jgi:hypothetical protein
MSETTARPGPSPAGLSPHPGSNPENQPGPKAPLLEFFQAQRVQHPELCYITSMAVGHPVSVYTGGSPDRRFAAESRAFFGFEERAYQVMCWDDSPGPGKAFWSWYLGERPQWYSSPEAACAAYVAGYAEWRRAHQAAGRAGEAS